MALTRRLRRLSTALLLLGLLTGCADVSRFEQGPLVAHGERLEQAREPLYYSIGIDVAAAYDERLMHARLQLSPDAPPLALAELSPALVSRYLPPFVPPPQWPEAWKQKARETRAYAGNGFHIDFKHGDLAFVGICSHCAGGRESPVVGTPDGGRLFALPLTEQQLREVFGAPQRIYRVNEVRY